MSSEYDKIQRYNKLQRKTTPTPTDVFFFCLDFLSQTFTIHRAAGERGSIYLTPLYHFHPLLRHLGVSRATAAENSPLRIASSWARTGNLWFSCASRSPLSYAPLHQPMFHFTYLQPNLSMENHRQANPQ